MARAFAAAAGVALALVSGPAWAQGVEAVPKAPWPSRLHLMQEKERRLRDLIKTVACVDEFADWLSPDELLRWSRELLRANEELDRLREELDKTPPE